MVESGIGLYKTECTHREGPWRGVDDLEPATLSWVHWFNTVRRHSGIGHVPPVEYETNYYAATIAGAEHAGVGQPEQVDA